MPGGQTPDEALPQVIAQLAQRIEGEASQELGAILLTASYVLMGLRLSRERAMELFQGVRKMRDSTTYQAILDEGRAEGEIKGLIKGREEGLAMGQVEEARQLLLRLGRKKLGPLEATVQEAIRAINDLQRLELLFERLLDVSSWQDLLQTP
jgi:predicted transposase YdaD